MNKEDGQQINISYINFQQFVSYFRHPKELSLHEIRGVAENINLIIFVREYSVPKIWILCDFMRYYYFSILNLMLHDKDFKHVIRDSLLSCRDTIMRSFR